MNAYQYQQSKQRAERIQARIDELIKLIDTMQHDLDAAALQLEKERVRQLEFEITKRTIFVPQPVTLQMV